MKTDFTYKFKVINKCNFCRTDSSNFKILGKRMNCSQGKNPQNKIGISTTVVKCNNCGLIFSNPMPIPESIQDHYGVPPESYWKPEYFKVDDNYLKNEMDWLNKLKKIKAGMKALDIGAGLGKAMVIYEKNGFDTYGLEPSITFYNKAIQKLKISEERLLNMSVEDADFPENLFDFISFGVVLEHLYDPSLAIEKALNWLKPGGIIHIEVPHSKWLIHKLINSLYSFRGMDYVGNLSPMHEPYHLYEFSLKSFEKNSKINDYTIVDSGYWVCQTYLPKVFDFPLRRIMKATNSGMQLVIWLSKN
ncbi:MAG TPA: class I SAM-dependent methyltransferase [Cytophagales bacterium]|jgi:ubiquinone/menaquinone biosynthesis C-methylase UbiE/ribosomal protein S27E|nr:class I SAM-dependent methyltransferase [Cytophagales bacterium]